MKFESCSVESKNNLLKQIDEIAIILGKKLPEPSDTLEMVVVIPAKNEGVNIQTTLAALSTQITDKDLAFDSKRYEVIILCHNCTDDTYLKCEDISIQYPNINIYFLDFNSDIANTVGAARRILMNIAAERLSIVNGLIITTDADTIPCDKWLFQLSKYLKEEYSLICGLITVNLEGLTVQAQNYLKSKDEYLILKARFENEYFPSLNNPWPRHSYNWGPNLAIKKSAYLQIGGIRPLHFLEDVDMYNRVFSLGLPIRHCINTKVLTSNRIDSRCDEGFGAELKVWSEIEGVAYNVEGIEKLKIRFEILVLIKSLFSDLSTETFQKISKLSIISVEDLVLIYSKCERYEAMRVEMENLLAKSTEWNLEYKNIDVREACEELRDHFELVEKSV